jgi:hypothetical protein
MKRKERLELAAYARFLLFALYEPKLCSTDAFLSTPYAGIGARP